eukprot:4459325-Pleurochrysis_carterae.AAC.2
MSFVFRKSSDVRMHATLGERGAYGAAREAALAEETDGGRRRSLMGFWRPSSAPDVRHAVVSLLIASSIYQHLV